MTQVIDRAATLLNLLSPSQGRREFGVKELAVEAELPLGTTYRILDALRRNGLVAQDPETRKYGLGWKVIELGFSAWQSSELHQLARPLMVGLARELQETIYLCVRDGLDGLYVEKVDSPLNLRITEPIGMRVPLHVGASKLVLLAHLPPSEQEEVIAGLQERNRTQGTSGVPINPELLEVELRRAVEQGYALTYGATTEGTAGLAVPVRDALESVVASLSAAGPANRYTEDRIPHIYHALRREADKIEQQMGHRR